MMFYGSKYSSNNNAIENIGGGGTDRRARTTTTATNDIPAKSRKNEYIEHIKQQRRRQQHDNDRTIIISTSRKKLIEQDNLLVHYNANKKKNEKVQSQQFQDFLYFNNAITSPFLSSSSSTTTTTTTASTVMTERSAPPTTMVTTSSTSTRIKITSNTKAARATSTSEETRRRADFGFTFRNVFYKEKTRNLAQLEQQFIDEQFLSMIKKSQKKDVKQKQKQHHHNNNYNHHDTYHHYHHRNQRFVGGIIAPAAVHKKYTTTTSRNNEDDHTNEKPFDNDDSSGEDNDNDNENRKDHNQAHNHGKNESQSPLLLRRQEEEQGQEHDIDGKNRNGTNDHDDKQDDGTYSIVQQQKYERDDNYNEGVEKLNHGDDDDDDSTTKSTACVLILYGIINAIIVLPVSMSFGHIIYNNDAFAPYLPTLIKLTVVSGVVHQLCFTTFSSLPFAVGNVQDAGLIFLSKMATDIVLYIQDHDDDEQEYNDEELLATTTIGLSITTAILGLALIVIGKARLAGYVQMVPKCVIAGYLAYIGWFCGKSGIRIMVVMVEQGGDGASSSGDELTFQQIWDNILFILPGIYGAIFIYVSIRTIRHVAVLPCCITFLMVMFYIILFAKGSSIEEATEQGWIRAFPNAGGGSSPEDDESRSTAWYKEIWQYLRFDKVVWSALPQLFVSEIGMIFIVALSSSLDVAAIELEMKQPLNYDHEIVMIGISNFISGLSGGYTGSYIFTQTIFSLRSGIQSRLAGYVLAITHFIIMVIPFPILSYIPNFFYGSLLGMICIDLVYEWLWEYRSRETTTRMEYVIALITFVMIGIWRVEIGVLAGILLYVILSQLDSWKNGGKTEKVVESNEEKGFLRANDNNDDDSDFYKETKPSSEEGDRKIQMEERESVVVDSEEEHRLLSPLI